MRPRRFSKSLVALWAKADSKWKDGELGPLDFDPVTNSQDPSVKSFNVKAERQDERKATVAATFSANPGHVRPDDASTVRYDFVREGGAWKIDNMRGMADGEEWNLRRILERYPN